MDIKVVRNATLLLYYNDKTFLIDPFFADKGSMPAFPNTPNQDVNNPLVSLTSSIEELIDVDAVFVTHLHPDHFDDKAIEMLPKSIPVYAQNDHDVQTIQEAGFTNVNTIDSIGHYDGIQITKTGGSHGRGAIIEMTGEVCGIVFHHEEEQTLYIAGDTVWVEEMESAIETHDPDVIVVNGGAAQFLEGGPITMTEEDIHETYKAARNAQIVVDHMESLNHCLLKRSELKDYVEKNNMTDRVHVPDDGEVLSF
ncbi:hypothetical protein N781_09505 [Pontibacillus halophilus JSM 076056 = DSM 19796]|uniref:Metallo-beta-lactamase domain-containing protein n=1 Tax=Pontibacillus halophilus JSM 076056 = DSM 19796 TaxID=1385510 RepID=A0A0A5G9M1_9BACI|nr:MBL fold metallo-hydrolase [Pontibacillus halophilus]KGX88744.1 hypothetical protein N781_09505 [Pontibacillus halophilus JSM 076056 = DSM 19796]